jgi:HlyD family secretion protein
VVDIGPVEKTIPAQGVVEPENEVLILSPASGIILSIEKGAGSRVNAGDIILRLDTRAILEQIGQIEDQLEVKQNNLNRTLLNARSIKVDLSYNIEVKKLKIASLKSDLLDQEQLLDVGGISTAKYEKTKQELALAQKDLEMIKEKNAIRLKQLEADEKGLCLQIEIQKKELMAKQELLNRMTIRAPSAGIILEENGKEGEKVNTDRLLVRMSDMSTFKLHAFIDDKLGDAIKTGQNVLASVNDEVLKGTIGIIGPEIRNRKIEFDVHLDKSDNKNLRPNQTVDLKIVQHRLDSVLRVKRGPAIEKGKTHNVYIQSLEVVIPREIKTGFKGDKYVEILSGVGQGDQVIISEYSPRGHLKKTKLSK